MQKKIFTTYHKGLWAETIAAMLLRLKGYHIVEQRYKSPLGEIDLIARRFNQIRFVEVKARNSKIEAINALSRKQQARIGRTALSWIAHHPQFYDFDLSFDMVLIVPKNFPCHFKNAFYYHQ